MHLGARAQAFACALKHSMGLPIRKVAAILRDMCGLNVSAGALAQMYQRVEGKAQVDPDTCIECGACVSTCPVSAISQ